jgi:hypothetical protein
MTALLSRAVHRSSKGEPQAGPYPEESRLDSLAEAFEMFFVCRKVRRSAAEFARAGPRQIERRPGWMTLFEDEMQA